jgi:hypothetical protein
VRETQVEQGLIGVDQQPVLKVDVVPLLLQKLMGESHDGIEVIAFAPHPPQ